MILWFETCFIEKANGKVVKYMKMDLPKQVSYIINTLEEHGYEAYAVGGCVRDTILGRVPQDWDITTSAKPEEIKRIFRKTIDTGIQHGTVTVMIDHVGYEVTTYRIDGEYEDNRHPKSVEYTTNLRLDLERRDFTINAMAYNETDGLVDAFGGIEDLHNGVIRCVGNPGARFDEDALRMLRAVRFSGQLAFAIDASTRKAIEERAANLKSISAERIRVELTKLLTAKDAAQIRKAYQTGMTAVFLPELDHMMECEQKNPHHIYTVGEHCIRSVEVMNAFFGVSVEKNAQLIPEAFGELIQDLLPLVSKKQRTILSLTMLLHDIGKPDTMRIDEKGVGHFYGHPACSEKMAAKILKRLTFDNETIDMTKHLIRWHDYRYGKGEKGMRKAMAKVGKDRMPLLLLVQTADVLAQNPDTFAEKLEALREAVHWWKVVVDSGAALDLKSLAITGSDLIGIGVKTGPGMGAVLKEVLEYVLENPSENQKENLLAYVKKHMNLS